MVLIRFLPSSGAIASTAPNRQYTTVGFHGMKVLSCRISVRLPNTSTQAALIQSVPWIFFLLRASHEIWPTVTAMATAVATKMSQMRRATRNDPTGRRSKRNFIQERNSTSREVASAALGSVPGRGGVLPHQWTRAGHATAVLPAIGQRHRGP